MTHLHSSQSYSIIFDFIQLYTTIFKHVQPYSIIFYHSSLVHINQFYTISLLLSHQIYSSSFFTSRFLLGFCDPKFGPSDSVDWLKEFEIKRKKIQKTANLRAREIDLWNDRKAQTGQGVIESLLVSVFFGDTQTKYIESILSGLALSFSIEEVETAPSACAARDGLSRVRLLVSAISGVGSSLRCYKGYDVCLNNMLQGFKVDESTSSDTYEDEGKGKGTGRGRGVGSGEGQRSLGRRNSDVRDDVGESEGGRDRVRDRDRESGNDLQDSTGHTPSTSTHTGTGTRTDTSYMGNSNDHTYKNEKKKEDADSATPSSSWLTQGDLPLLARPLLDTAVLLLALTHPSVLYEEEETVQETFDEIVAATAVSGYSASGQVILRGQIICEIEGSSAGFDKDEGKGKQVDTHYHQEQPGASACAIRWLCIAALVQLMVADYMQGDVSVGDTLPSSSSTSSSTPSFSSSSTVTHDGILESWSVSVLYTKLASVVQCNTSTLHGYTPSSAPLTQDTKRVTSVLQKWHAFLSVIARMLFLCRPDLAAELSCYPLVDLISQVRPCFLSYFLS